MNGQESGHDFQRVLSPVSNGNRGARSVLINHQNLSRESFKSGKSSKSKDATNYVKNGSRQNKYGKNKGSATASSKKSCSDVESGKIVMSMTDIEFHMSDEEECGAGKQLPRAWHNYDKQKSLEEVNGRKPPSTLSNLQKCENALCDSSTCLWHQTVLKYPQFACWEPATVRVELNRSEGRDWPGFDHKVLKHRDKNEIYVIVKSIKKGGIASNSGLCVGDFILSVNGTALHTDTLGKINFNKEETLVFQVQHLLSLKSDTDSLKKQSKVQLSHSPGSSVKSLPLPASSPPDQSVLSNGRENIPMTPIVRPGPDNLQPLPKGTVFICGSKATEFVTCLAGDMVNNYQLNSPATSFQASMTRPLSCTPGNTNVTGHQSYSILFQEMECTSGAQLNCINVLFVVVEDDDFFHHCCPWLFSPDSVFILTFDTNRLLASSTPQTEMSRLKSLAYSVRTGMMPYGGGGYRRPPQNGAGCNCGINSQQQQPQPLLRMVGLNSSPDQNYEICTFFYTFQGEGLEGLEKPYVIPAQNGPNSQELANLRSDIFQMLVGGRLNSSRSVSSTLNPSPVSPGGYSFNSDRSPHSPASSPVFSPSAPCCFPVQPSTPHLRISYSTAMALDDLTRQVTLTITQDQLIKMLLERSKKDEGDMQFLQVIDNLKKSKNLILSTYLNMGCWTEKETEYVIPSILLDRLCDLTAAAHPQGAAAQDNVFDTLSSKGVIPRQQFIDLLRMLPEKDQSSHVTNLPEKLLLCLEELHMAFPMRLAHQAPAHHHQHFHNHQQQLHHFPGMLSADDSGFEEPPGGVLFPYFVKDVNFNLNLCQPLEDLWAIQFSGEIPLSSFYCILSDVSKYCPHGMELTMRSQHIAQLGKVGASSDLTTPTSPDPARSTGLPPTAIAELPSPRVLPPLQPPAPFVFGVSSSHTVFIQFCPNDRQIRAYLKRSGIGSISPGGPPPPKMAQVYEHLSPQCMLAIAQTHVSGATECHLVQQTASATFSPLSPIVSVPVGGDAASSLPPAEEDVEIALPEAPLDPPSPGQNDDEERQAHRQMLKCPVKVLRHIHKELNDICRYLSINNDWEKLAGLLGYSALDVHYVRSLFQTQPLVAIGKTFLEAYMNEKDLSLGRLMKALLDMGTKNYKDMAQRLWTAALLNNSLLYIQRRRNGSI